jgi:hypothetical protein
MHCPVFIGLDFGISGARACLIADDGAPRKTLVSSLPRRREPSWVNELDSRFRGNDGFFEVPNGDIEDFSRLDSAASTAVVSPLDRLGRLNGSPK